MPDNEWYVVVGSYGAPETALAGANELARKFPGKFQVGVCQPIGGADARYRIVVGEHLSYADAARLKAEAIKTGFPQETWVWNPIEMGRAIQR